MKGKEKIKCEKIKDKYFLYLYIIVLMAGIMFLFVEIQDIQNTFGVKFDVFVRFSLFIINITVPYIIWQHFFSHILIKHQKAKDNRRYIWKSRAIIFRQRRNYYIFYIIVALILAFFCLKTFGKSFFEEAFLLLFATILTLGMPVIQLYFYSNNFIRHTNKNMNNNKVYSPFYIQSLRDKNIIRQSQIDENETDNTIDAIIENNELYSPTIQVEDKKVDEVIDIEKITPIDPDMIFRSDEMYNKFQKLEQKLIADKYLDENLNWISRHDNRTVDIKSLVTFLVGLVESRYFLPNKDPKIKIFFETRYTVTIGQNFERSRRTPLLDQYPVIFHDYKF